jgi:AcrR family transcriptional regulator
MELERKTDLRVLKTREAIKNAFREMVCEMDADEITVKELSERAMIHRKTFYLHYTCIEALFEDMIKEASEVYFEAIDKISPTMPMDEVNQVFFDFLGQQDTFLEKLICAPSYRSFSNKMFSIALVHNRSRYNPYAHLSPEKQSLVNNFLVSSSLDFYRQWVADGKKVPLDELTELTSKLLNKGVSSILE